MLRQFTAVSAILLLSIPVLAQNQPKKSPSTPPTKISKPPSQTPPKTTPAPKPAEQAPPAEVITLVPDPVSMSDEVLRLETAGLTIHLPLGSVSQSTSAADKASAKITPPPPDTSWMIEIQNPRSRDKTQNPDTVARSVLDALKKSVGEVDRSRTDREGNVIEKLISTRAVVIEDVKHVIVKAERPEFERPAARFYVKLPTGDKGASFVRGYTVFQTAQGEFITFELKTLESNFTKCRSIYEATIATARFTDASALTTARGAAIESGMNFFSKVAAPDYDAAIAALNDQYFRLYKPSTGADKDAKEIAYRRVRAERGARGKIDPNSNPAKWSETDKEQGIIVRLDARFLQDEQVIDIVGVYWMSTNGTQEAWNLQTAIRDPKRRTPGVLNEVGAREGDQMAVTRSGSGQDSQRIKPEVPKMGYITQVQAFLLPTLLAQKHAIGDYGFYVYKSQNESRPITMRRDSLTEATDGSNNVVLTSHQSENVADQVSTYEPSGKLVQTISAAEKTVWTPITLQKLVDLWKAQGLPMN